jgi:hypothetical protein
MIPAAFNPFLDQAPFCVMARLSLERLFSPEPLDALFRRTSQQQQRELLFSELVELMIAVVLRVDASVHAAFQKRATTFKVSDQAIYNRLQRVELKVSAALVADSAAQVGPVIDCLQARLPPWLPGYRARVLDGNHLAATENRIEELRHTWAAPLPGKVLAVYEQEQDLVTNVFLTQDGHAQERSLLDDVLTCVRFKDMWIGDRNFCTLKFMHGIAAGQAAFVLRQHGQLEGQLVGERRSAGAMDSGKVYEQTMVIEYAEQKLHLRRITVELEKPTRDGHKELHILTNLPARDADAVQVADLYRKRWTIEKRFYEITQTLNGEPNTLGYPKAALFAFCLALVASNAVAMMKASLRAVHTQKDVDKLSNYYMALEIRQTYIGMMVALPAAQWQAFRSLTVEQWADVLREVAGHVDLSLRRYQKAPKRSPKKPVRRDKYKNGGHVSTHKLLEKRNK